MKLLSHFFLTESFSEFWSKYVSADHSKKETVHPLTNQGIIFILLCVSLHGAPTKPSLIIKDDFNDRYGGVLKWDCPVFEAYSSGEVIWRKHWACSVDALMISKGGKADRIVAKFAKLTEIYNGKIYTLTNSSDPVETIISYRDKSIKIRGNWRKAPFVESADLEANANSVFIEESGARSLWLTLPAEIRTALSEAADFDDKDASPWRPEQIIVTLWPAGGGEAVPWTNEWSRGFVPIVNEPPLIRKEFVGSMLDQLLKLLTVDGRLPKFVLLDGEKKYAEISFKFPG